MKDRTDRTDRIDEIDEIPLSARRLVWLALTLLLVPGIVGFDLWPLNGWRLYSVAWKAERTQFVVEALDAAGVVSPVDLDELPLGYRHAEWPMMGLPGASAERRDDMCQALADAVVEARPTTVEVRLTQDRERLVEQRGQWRVNHDPTVLATCKPAR